MIETISAVAVIAALAAISVASFASYMLWRNEQVYRATADLTEFVALQAQAHIHWIFDRKTEALALGSDPERWSYSPNVLWDAYRAHVSYNALLLSWRWFSPSGLRSIVVRERAYLSLVRELIDRPNTSPTPHPFDTHKE